MITKLIAGHLTNAWQDWKQTKVFQRDSRGFYYTTSDEDGVKTRQFEVDQHTPTGSFFHHAPLPEIFLQDLGYGLAFLPHRAAMATQNVWHLCLERFPKERAKKLAIDVVVFSGATYLPTTVLAVAAAFSLHALHNPRGARRHLAMLESSIFSDGEYSLARMIGMQCLGDTTEKVRHNLSKFEFVGK
jgi:hypothetical protein